MIPTSTSETGLLGVFDHPDDLVDAIGRVKKLKVKKMDAFTPFPIHEVIHALGLKRSLIPYVTLVMALIGMCVGFGFQSWTMAVDWPINIGGKPNISWPAFIPITFELTILIGGLSTFAALILICQLPNRKKAPLDLRLTDDKFGLFVEKQDPQFNENELSKIFRECNVREIKTF